jgi:hypothetical protein
MAHTQMGHSEVSDRTDVEEALCVRLVELIRQGKRSRASMFGSSVRSFLPEIHNLDASVLAPAVGGIVRHDGVAFPISRNAEALLFDREVLY